MQDSSFRPLFRLFPTLQRQWTPLLTGPTPVMLLSNVGRAIGHKNLYVKREDLTAPLYGGNKVRNLEFIFGRAQHLGYRKVAMVAPLGSNFVAAAAAHAARVGMKAEFYHYISTSNEQILRHADFARVSGAKVKVSGETLWSGLIKSSAGFAFQYMKSLMLGESIYRLPMGGSDVLGALGHVNAALELAEQIKRGQIPPMRHLVVGVGTCGTLAGLIVGLRIANLSLHVHGVRCVPSFICNRWHVATLANQIIKKLNLSFVVKPEEIILKDYTFYDLPNSKHKLRYAQALPGAFELIDMWRDLENLTLDTTYTSKVIHFLQNAIQDQKGFGANDSILYWHTFSPAAMTRPTESKLAKSEGENLLLGSQGLIPFEVQVFKTRPNR